MITKYNIDGQIDDSLEEFGVALSNDNNYYIKQSTYGINLGQFFNPITDFKEDLKKMNNVAGRKLYEYKMVTKEQFDYYIEFLKTKNIAFYKMAGRK